MLSVTCKAAIKSVVYLGSKFESGNKCGTREIAEFIEENEHTVGKLLQKLVKEEVINSVKGPNGGFYITSRQMGQPIMNIVGAIDGQDVFKQCGMGLSKCSATHPCPIHNDYKPIRDRFEKLCSNKKISDLCVPVNNGLAYLFG
jgi:Rrf2 family protein